MNLMKKVLINIENISLVKVLSSILQENSYEFDVINNKNFSKNEFSKYALIIVDLEYIENNIYLDFVTGLEKTPIIINTNSNSIKVDLFKKYQIASIINDDLDKNDFLITLKKIFEVKDALNSNNSVIEFTIKKLFRILIEINSHLYSKNSNFNPKHRYYCKLIASKLEYQKLYEVDIASLLCNIGFVGIDQNIIQKVINNEDKTHNETISFLNHTEIAYKLLSGIENIESIRNGIRFQNLWFDGRNSDENIKGESIPVISRILLVVNDFISFQIKNSIDEKEALRIMFKTQNKYCPKCFSILLKEITGNRRLEKKPQNDKLKVNLNEKLSKNSLYYKLEEIKDNMIIAEDVFDDMNNKVVKKGSKLNVYTKHFLSKMIENKRVKNSTKVYID